ncbi:histone H1-like [Heptranchias perlo]|uniref:histone H1-like n=1 Tax=Heptranchias perlo TaxID=212740 RepID=UPI00355A3124
MGWGDPAGDPSRGKKARKRRSPPRARQAGGRASATLAGQIMEAVASSKERRGLSLVAVKKVLSAAGFDVSKNNSRVNQTVRSLVTSGSLLQTAGTGANGSFKVNRRRYVKTKSRLAAGRRRAASRGRYQRKAAAAKRSRRKRSPARKSKPRIQRKNGRAGGGPGQRRVRIKGGGGVRKAVRRGVGRPRRAAKELPPADGQLRKQEAQQYPSDETAKADNREGGIRAETI